VPFRVAVRGERSGECEKSENDFEQVLYQHSTKTWSIKHKFNENTKNEQRAKRLKKKGRAASLENKTTTKFLAFLINISTLATPLSLSIPSEHLTLI